MLNMKNIVGVLLYLPFFILLSCIEIAGWAQDEAPEAQDHDNIEVFSNDVASQRKARQDLFHEAEVTLALDEEAGRMENAVQVQKPYEILHRASTVYRERKDYLQAFELAQGVLDSHPGHYGAQRLQKAILHDIDDHAILFDRDQPYKLPEGLIAYKVAISDGVLTVDEAVAVALKSSVKLASIKKKVDGAEGKMLEAKRAFYPTLTGEISVNGGIVGGDSYTGEAFKLNVSQPVYYGGELIYTLRQAEANLESDKAKYEKERLDLVHKTREGYFGVVKADYNMSYQGGLLDDVSVVKDRVSKAFEQKLVPDVDYLEVLAIFHQVFATKESAMNDFQSADLLFHQVLGLDPEDPAPVSTELEYEDIPIDLDEVRLLAQKQNPDVRIKKAAADGAYYGLKVYDAKKLPRVDIRGSAGWSGEVRTDVNTSPDIEKEWSLFVDGSIPFGANTFKYNFRRRRFGPTVLDVTGSEDFKHTWSLAFLDALGDITDRDLAIGTYLEAKGEVETERMNADINVRDYFYDYHQALISIDTALARLNYLEKEVNILKALVELEEARTPDLLNEMVSLAEERYAYVRSITDLHLAVSKINATVGDENYLSMGGLKGTGG